MKANTSIKITEQTITHPTTGFDGSESRVPATGQAGPKQNGAKEQGRGKPESELRAAARRKGLTLKELANLMGVSYGYVSQVSAGSRSWTPMLRERAMAVLGEVPGQGVVYRQGGLVTGESTCIRERAREVGLSMGALADLVGVSRSHMSMASRGKRNFSPGLQARVEAVLEAPAKVEAAQCPTVDTRALWDRMDAHGYSQNQVARLGGISTGHLSLIMNGQRTPSGDVLRRLHEVLFRPTAAELVAPVELKVMGWKKDDRKGVVVKGAGGPHSGSRPGGGAVRIGGRVPWGAEVQYAYTSGYDSRGRVSVNHIVDGLGYGGMLKRREPDVVQRSVPMSGHTSPYRMTGHWPSRRRTGHRCLHDVLSRLARLQVIRDWFRWAKQPSSSPARPRWMATWASSRIIASSAVSAKGIRPR